ncbi:MAG TPA: type II secretion system F family protein [Stellaceae bacterium]|nr:type II secretion system F family protein [Stellaceae bacterium]
MPSFQWSAVSANGEVIRGVTEAADRAAVIDRLQRQGQIVLRAEPADSHKRGRATQFLRLEFGKRRELDKLTVAEFTREVATMLGAGQDLDRALRFVADNVGNGRAQSLLTELRDKVRGGSSLAGALAEYPRSFSRLYIGLVRAGEAGGTLSATLERLADLLERERKLAASMRASLAYPAVLVLAAIGSIVLLLEYVLPQFAPIFEEAGANLPFAARFLIALGDAVGTALPWTLIFTAAIVLGLRRALAYPPARLWIDRLLLRLPIAGALLRESLAARLTRTLGTLLQNGMALINALALTKDALGNAAAVAAVEFASLEAKAGRGLARPLSNAGVFPARTTHLMQLGEETASLAAMCLKAADIHEERARLMLQRLVALAVPLITITMGLAVAGIVGTLITTMLSLNDLVG